MTPTPPDLEALLERARERLGGVKIDAMEGDNLAITLCTHFDNPDQEQDDDTGWSEDGVAGYEATLDAIHAHYVAALSEIPAILSHSTRQAERIEIARAALAELLPSALCGESWGLPDEESVSISVNFGKIRRARAALSSLDSGSGEA